MSQGYLSFIFEIDTLDAKWYLLMSWDLEGQLRMLWEVLVASICWSSCASTGIVSDLPQSQIYLPGPHHCAAPSTGWGVGSRCLCRQQHAATSGCTPAERVTVPHPQGSSVFLGPPSTFDNLKFKWARKCKTFANEVKTPEQLELQPSLVYGFNKTATWGSIQVKGAARKQMFN